MCVDVFKFIELVDVIRIRGRRNAIRGRREVEAASTKLEGGPGPDDRDSNFPLRGRRLCSSFTLYKVRESTRWRERRLRTRGGGEEAGELGPCVRSAAGGGQTPPPSSSDGFRCAGGVPSNVRPLQPSPPSPPPGLCVPMLGGSGLYRGGGYRPPWGNGGNCQIFISGLEAEPTSRPASRFRAASRGSRCGGVDSSRQDTSGIFVG